MANNFVGEDQLQLCYAEFRKPCIQGHDLQEWGTTPHVHLDLEHWMFQRQDLYHAEAD
jgi:hypothetical protein